LCFPGLELIETVTVKPNFRTLRPADGGKAQKRWIFGAQF
jgi:hypothetical protein